MCGCVTTIILSRERNAQLRLARPHDRQYCFDLFCISLSTDAQARREWSHSVRVLITCVLVCKSSVSESVRSFAYYIHFADVAVIISDSVHRKIFADVTIIISDSVHRKIKYVLFLTRSHAA